MGLRFRKSFTIMPGVRVNLGRRGTSITLGTRGVHGTISSSGRVTGTVGIPGTGLSWSERADLGGKREDIRPSGVRMEIPEDRIDETRKAYRALYKKSDEYIDWTQVALRGKDYMNGELMPYLEGIFSKDISTYVGLFEKYDVLEELTEIISSIQVGMNSGDSLSVNYDWDSEKYFPSCEKTSEESRSANILYALSSLDVKIARDVFALLPVENVIVDSRVEGEFVLSVRFHRSKFLGSNFSRSEPLKLMEEAENIFRIENGRLVPITTFDGD